LCSTISYDAVLDSTLTHGEPSTDVSATPDRSLRPAESRRVKAVGLALIVAGGAALAVIVDRATSSAAFSLQQLGIWIATGIVFANVIAVGAMVLRAGFGHAHAGRRGQVRVRALQLTAANVAAPALMWLALREDVALEKRLAAAGWEVWPDALSLVLGLFAWRLWRRSRRHEVMSADEALALDARPPILYLRSFRDDGEIAAEGGTPAHWALRLSRAGSDEETMATILARFGPVVAIGKPGESLPELGAARLYVTHDQWQQRVIDLMRQARLVVIRIGSSRGVLWEIEQALAQVPRQRLVFALLGEARDASETVERLRSLLGESVTSALPEAKRRDWRTVIQGQSNRRIGGLIWFTADGRARTTSIQRPVQSIRDVRYYTNRVRLHGALEHAWDEVLTKLGLAQHASAPHRSRLYAVMLAVLLGAFGAHWFYLGNRRRGWIYVALLPLLMAPLFVSFVDAVRFILADAREFQTRWGRLDW
jgi:TM2 domain